MTCATVSARRKYSGMKQSIYIFAASFLILYTFFACSEQDSNTVNSNTEEEFAPADSSDAFDAKLAAELGADEYGMKRYVIALLKRGPNQNQDSVEVARLQRAHLDNIGKLADARKLVVAGPFMDDTDLRGIYIFDVETVEEARKLTETDPAIKAGRLVMELHEWYGSAALIRTAEIHKTISKSEI